MTTKTTTKKKITPKSAEIKVDESAEVVTPIVEEAVEEETTVAENVTEESAEDISVATDEEVTVNETESTPRDKKVRICPAVNHRCSIGGVVYDLKKGVQTNVPEFVKTILQKENLLQAL